MQKFESSVAALDETAALVDAKVTPRLSSFLNELKAEKKASLAVADPKLGNAISQLPGLSLKLVSDSSTQEVFRAIRDHMSSLIPDLVPSEIDSTRLGLSHSLSRQYVVCISGCCYKDKTDLCIANFALARIKWIP